MLKKLFFLIICLFTVGCAALQYKGVGSKYWYQERIQEIELAHDSRDITKEKMLELKVEADRVRQEYIKEEQRHYYHSQHYSYHPRRHYGHHGRHCPY